MGDDVAEAIKRHFRQADLSGSGLVDGGKLRELFKAIGQEWSDQDIDNMFAVFGQTGDGTVDYEKFVDWALGADEGQATAVESRAAMRASIAKPIAFVPGAHGSAGSVAKAVDMATPLSVIVFGATGDLARKKLYPALYQLIFGCPDAPLLPQTTRVVGYGRSAQDRRAFLDKQCVNVAGDKKGVFLEQCFYFQGSYTEEDFVRLHDFLCGLEACSDATDSNGDGTATPKRGTETGEVTKANRIFFLSVPPSAFAEVCACVKKSACAPGDGFTRLIIEKPFGHDSESFAKLQKATSSLFPEDSLFRIDHYLGKEVVLNLVTLRFGNQIFEHLWNRESIQHVQIVFKEDLGTGGRGAYFDTSGIIRDIMQNHLLQVLLWLAMEPPAALNRTHVQQEKCKLLKAIRTLKLEHCFLGQFGRGSWKCKGQTHEEPGYLDDPGVPKDSRCPTFAAVVLQIDNDRWRGVPFLMRAGKGLDERLAEVRVTFKPQAHNALVPGSANELVMRIQPDEAIYLKIQNKLPGWEQDRSAPVVLDMSYATSFQSSYVADAYERMFLNTARGDGSLFVGSDELHEAWRIFTPLLKEIEADSKAQPIIYPFGVRVPEGMDAFANRYGIDMGESWQEGLACLGKNTDHLRQVFNELDQDGAGLLNHDEVKAFARRFNDGREPSDKQLARIIDRLDLDADGKLSFQELSQGVEALRRCSVKASLLDHTQWKEQDSTP